MSTAAIAGYGGSVGGLGTPVEVKEWSINVTCEALDATSFASGGYKEFIPGLQGADGSFTCLGTAIVARGATTGTFKTKATGGATISGSVIVTGVTVGTPVDGIVSQNVSFNFTGSVTVA